MRDHVRSRQAAALRLAGMTYPQIAQALGYASPSGALRAVRRAIAHGEADPSLRTGRLSRPRTSIGDAADERHGTTNGYGNLGCRCVRCRAAHAESHANYMRHRRELAETVVVVAKYVGEDTAREVEVALRARRRNRNSPTLNVDGADASGLS